VHGGRRRRRLGRVSASTFQHARQFCRKSVPLETHARHCISRKVKYSFLEGQVFAFGHVGTIRDGTMPAMDLT
jgi:hypothetical protein